MRIGIFTDAYEPAISGVVTSVKMLASGLRSLGHEVYIFTTLLDDYVETDPIEQKYVIRFKGFTVPFKALSNYKLSSKLRRKARQIKRKYDLDVLHIQTEFSMGKLGLRVAKKMNVPCVYTFHTMYEEYLPYISSYLDKHFHTSFFAILRKMILSPINKAAKIIIVPTKKVYSQINNYGLTGDIRIVPTGLELERFTKEYDKEEITTLRRELNIKDETFIFLFLGRLSKEKSVDRILHSFAESQKGKDSVLLIVGDGPAKEQLVKLVKKLNIESQVIFKGAVDWTETPKYYKLGDIFVNASTSETQGLTYVEALSSGLPVLVQDDECLEGVVENNYNGYIFDGEIDLIEKMNAISIEELKKMKANCAKSVEKFSKMCYATNVQNIYLDATNKE